MTENLSIDEAAAIVSAEFAADIFFYSGPINDVGYGMLAEEVARSKSAPNALLILTTAGGSANSAYQIARLIQKTYKEFILFSPSYCVSAGTLVALGAHKLIMDPFSELGPLDVQLYKPDEIAVRKSGLLSKSTFESLADVAFDTFENIMLKITLKSDELISFKVASEVSAEIVSNVMAPIYAQLSPDVIGSDYREMSVALEYGRRLAGFGGNISLANVTHLIHHYPAHDFIIDDAEAATLFHRVGDPSDGLYDLVALLGNSVYDQARSPQLRSFSGDESPTEADADENEGDENGQNDRAEMAENRPNDRQSDPVAASPRGNADAPSAAPEDGRQRAPSAGGGGATGGSGE